MHYFLRCSKCGSPVDAVDRDQRRPLHLAAESGDVTISEVLVACGARNSRYVKETFDADLYCGVNDLTNARFFLPMLRSQR